MGVAGKERIPISSPARRDSPVVGADRVIAGRRTAPGTGVCSRGAVYTIGRREMPMHGAGRTYTVRLNGYLQRAVAREEFVRCRRTDGSPGALLQLLEIAVGQGPAHPPEEVHRIERAPPSRRAAEEVILERLGG